MGGLQQSSVCLLQLTGVKGKVALKGSENIETSVETNDLRLDDTHMPPHSLVSKGY